MLRKAVHMYNAASTSCAKGLSAGSPSSMVGKTATQWKTLLFAVHGYLHSR
jgi:hypothetical protein